MRPPSNNAGSVSIIRYDVNILEVAAQLVVIQSVAYDEFVADFERAVADRQRLVRVVPVL